MFHIASDIVEATAVMLFTGRTNSDADYERYVTTIAELDRKFVDREPVVIVVVEIPATKLRTRCGAVGSRPRPRTSRRAHSSSS